MAPKWIQRAAIKSQSTPVQEQNAVVETRIRQRIGKNVSNPTMHSLKMDIATEVRSQRNLLKKLLGIK